MKLDLKKMEDEKVEEYHFTVEDEDTTLGGDDQDPVKKMAIWIEFVPKLQEKCHINAEERENVKDDQEHDVEMENFLKKQIVEIKYIYSKMTYSMNSRPGDNWGRREPSSKNNMDNDRFHDTGNTSTTSH